MIFRAFKSIASRLGYDLIKNIRDHDFSEFMEIYLKCQPYTMTSVDRMYALYKAVEYIVKNNIAGSFVECGVWKGGSSMLIALTLIKFKTTSSSLWLFDTFEGMSEPTALDRDAYGNKADDLLKKSSRLDQESIWCYSSYEEVVNNLKGTNYPFDQIHFVKGKVEDTIPLHSSKEEIALLRLDTDWYESTKHELHHLFPLLVKKGVLIIDDYGHWEGSRKAVDEYLMENSIPLLLQKVDYTARMAVKC